MADEISPPPSGPQSRAFRAAIDDVSKQRRTVTAKINTAVVDRYRTVILPAGADFRAFMRTPAVLWEHGQDPTRGRQAIGHCSSIKYRRLEDDILAVTQFKTDEYSDAIFNDYANGTLTAFSIDFLPGSNCGSPTPEEIRSHPEWASAYCIYRSWELTGYSAVSYPGNPEALALAVERGLWVPDEVRRSLPVPARAMAEGSGAAGGYATEVETEGETAPSCGRRVVERDGKWCVMDGETVCSQHETEAEAEAACERANAPAEDTGAEPAPEKPRTAPPPALPAGIRTYTSDELAALIGRRVFEPMFAMFDRSLQDAEDLARGRV